MEISSKFETPIDSFIVIFPEFVTLESLMSWGQLFLEELDGKVGVGLLVDTGSHNFESIECLRWLKEFLTQQNEIEQRINKVAFVSPANFRRPEIVNGKEAYFSSAEDARIWLQ